MDIQHDISLKPYNTFAIDVKANYFAACNSVETLQEILHHSSHDTHHSLLVLGGGSNILFTKDYGGLVLKNEIGGIDVINEDEEHIYVRAGAGVNWHSFVLFCIEHNYAGVENLSLIPGSVGASPMQNIGAYGAEIKDVFHSLEALHIKDNSLNIFSLDECRFGYRESVFKHQYKGQFIITGVTYKLNKTPHFNTTYGAINGELEKMGVKELSIKAISQAVINIRTAKLPDWKVIGNAGSFFKNPTISNAQFEVLKKSFPHIVAFPAGDAYTKLAAGWLIEQCGWKGYRNGDAGCYSKQALVLVNYGAATGKELFDLSTLIIESVQQKFGVILEREVNII